MRHRLGMMSWLAPVLSVALLGALFARNITFPQPEDAEPHHARVRIAAEQVPYKFGNWQGADGEVVPAAIKLLKPNVLIKRSYRNSETGRQASLLIVHTPDARYLRGHYPPVCYPHNGWTPVSQRPWNDHVAGLDISGRKYIYRINYGQAVQEIEVSNCLVLPDGRILWNMDEVYRQAGDYVRRFYGAGQVQVVIGTENTTAQQRDQIVHDFIEASAPVIRAMRSGISP
jgi:hypothetical protein